MPDNEKPPREQLAEAIQKFEQTQAELKTLTEATVTITKALQKLHKVFGSEYDENLVTPGEILGVQFKDVSF